MRLNALGHLAAACWLALPGHVPGIELDEYVVMPNHMHGLLTLRERIDLPSSSSVVPVKRITLGQVVALYKAAVTRAANRMIRPALGSIWQSRYHERIVRDETELNRFREYLIHNPARWQEDQFYSPKP